MCLLREKLGQRLENKWNIKKNTEIPGKYAEMTVVETMVHELEISGVIP